MMQQVFNFQQLGNSLAGLFDGSNATRGRADRARAEYEEQRARELKRQNDMLDASARDEISAQLAFGGDTVKIRQALQDLPVPKMIQPQEQNQLGGLFKSGAGYAVAPSQTDLGRGESAEMGQQYMNSRYTMSAEDQNAFKRAMQNVIMHAAMGGNGRTMGQNLLDFEKQDRYNGLQNMAMGAVDQGTRNAIMSLAEGKTYDPYALNADGLLYNKGTGQVDASNPFAQANLNKIGAQTGLIGAQTQNVQNDTALDTGRFGLDQKKTEFDIQNTINNLNKPDETLFIKYVDNGIGGQTKVVDNAALQEAIAFAKANDMDVNTARRMILSGQAQKVAQTRNEVIAQYTSPTFNAGQYLPNAAQQKEAELGALVAQGKLTAQQAEAQFNAFMKGGR